MGEYADAVRQWDIGYFPFRDEDVVTAYRETEIVPLVGQMRCTYKGEKCGCLLTVLAAWKHVACTPRGLDLSRFQFEDLVNGFDGRACLREGVRRAPWEFGNRAWQAVLEMHPGRLVVFDSGVALDVLSMQPRIDEARAAGIVVNVMYWKPRRRT